MKLRDKLEELPDDALLNGGEVDLLFNWSRTRRWRYIRDGKFPAPVRMPGSNVGYWTLGTIRRLLADLTKAA